MTGDALGFTIDLVLRGRFFTALIAAALSISVPGAGLAGCMSGPADTPMSQMACCKNGHQDCHKSGRETDCCKTKGHDRQQNADQQDVAKASSIVKVSVDLSANVDVQVLPLVVPHISPVSAIPLFNGTSSPPRLAFSVLLI